jgi:hypothetical protein
MKDKPKASRKPLSRKKQQPTPPVEEQQPDLATPDEGAEKGEQPSSHSRRSFLGRVAAAAAVAGVIGVPEILKPSRSIQAAIVTPLAPIGCATAPGCDIEILTPTGRANVQLAKRVSAAIYDRLQGVPPHPCNGDEVLYKNSNYIGNFTKALKKINNFGEVDPVAYCALLTAVRSNNHSDFENVPLGCVPCNNTTNFNNYSDMDGTTMFVPPDDTYYTDYYSEQQSVTDAQPYSNSTDASQLSAEDKARIYGGTVNTPAQDQADQNEAIADQSSSVPQEAQARLGITTASANTQRRLVDPQGGLAYQLEDVAVTQLAAPPAPTLAGSDTASEMVELYWESLVRDVSFINWGSNANITAAISDLNARFKPIYAGLPQFEIVPTGFTARKEPRGFPTQPMTPLGQIPGSSNLITLQTLFRGFTKGDQMGPFLSQFLIKDTPYGPQTIPAKIQPAVAQDYMMDPASWLFIQKGCMPGPVQILPTPRYIINGRDISRYIEFCLPTQPYINAMADLLQMPDAQRNDGGGYGIAFDPNNPYNHSCTQEGFVTFGPTHILALLNKVGFAAHSHTWHEKWFVHRRLRPEEYGGWVNFTFRNEKIYPINSVLGTSTVVPKIAAKTGGYYFLPQAFPEGSPVHPSYTAGHATLAGACVTVLKAFFNDQALIPNPKQPNADGSALVPYTGSDANQLTVGGELNKLASNIGYGRMFAGVHWRSDNTASLLRGEDVAVSFLEDWGFIYNEPFAGFEFTDFRGVRRTGIGRKR